MQTCTQEDLYLFDFNAKVGPRFARRLHALICTKFHYGTHEVDVFNDGVEIQSLREISKSRRFALDCYIQGVLDGSSNWKA